ncbi:MAG: energy transducer TonB [Acidobacteria bacterium]|nr:energy transducer TonB [Acidobacteriota bacterium]MBS1867741.1 energy transducer TonB [Acidobacteriota bacterium]
MLPFSLGKGVGILPPAVFATSSDWSWPMETSTSKRRLAQLICLVAVFGIGTGIVIAQQENDRKVIKKVEPEYPTVLRDKGIGGTVRLRVTVKVDGTVKDVQTIGGNAVLVESATRAVKQWRYAPGEHETVIDVSIHFGQRP